MTWCATLDAPTSSLLPEKDTRMSDRLRKGIEGVAAAVALVAGLSGMFGAFVLLPSRVEGMERQVARLNERDEKAREMLVRIEERLIQVQTELNKRKVQE